MPTCTSPTVLSRDKTVQVSINDARLRRGLRFIGNFIKHEGLFLVTAIRGACQTMPTML